MLQSRRNEILSLARATAHATCASLARLRAANARPDSDVDLLVDMEPGRSLFDLGGLLYDLQTQLGVDVDVVTEKGLRPRIRAQVMREAIPL